MKTKDQSERTKEKLSEEVLLLAYDQFVSGRETRSKNKKEPDESDQEQVSSNECQSDTEESNAD